MRPAVCAAPGCATLTMRRYCDQHRVDRSSVTMIPLGKEILEAASLGMSVQDYLEFQHRIARG